MKKVLILKDCKYAQYRPHLPALDFVAGSRCLVEDSMASSMIKNGDGEPAEATQDSSRRDNDESEALANNTKIDKDNARREADEFAQALADCRGAEANEKLDNAESELTVEPEIKEKPLKRRGKKRNKS